MSTTSEGMILQENLHIFDVCKTTIIAYQFVVWIKLRWRIEISHHDYVRDLKHSLYYAYDLTTKESEKHQQINKKRRDTKDEKSSIEPGDRVFVDNLSCKGMQNFLDRWKPVVHIVLD